MPPPTPLDLLSDFGQLMADDLDDYSLENAVALASGSLPMIVLLQEPCNLADTLPFDKLVHGDRCARKGSARHRGSPTLQEINNHTLRVSNAEHDLHDIRIFELNPLLSPGVLLGVSKCKRANDRWLAQSTTWKMIKAEPPKVMLVLTTGAGRSDVPGMRQFQCSLKTAGSIEKINIRGQECLVIYGFHPSVYLRDDYVLKRGWSRADVSLAKGVLRFCFRQAFACRQDREAVPMNGEMLRRWEELTEPRQFIREMSGSRDVGIGFARASFG